MSVHNETALSPPIRVLHIAFTMHARGTETWLMNILRHIDRKQFQMDFVTIKEEEGVYDQEIRSLGSNLYSCTHHSNKQEFLKDFSNVLQKQGPYDIIHAHPYTISGLIVRQAAKNNIPVRITHSHTDRRKVRRDKSFIRRIYINSMKKLIQKFSTYGLAASHAAAASLFGEDWEQDNKYNVMHCGIDLKPFKQKADVQTLRKELNIPEQAKIIGHVGSFHFEKNHDFLLNLFAEIVKKEPDLHLLLIGDGPLWQKLEEQAKHLGIEKQVSFTGIRQDVPALLQTINVFAFPSLFEGLGLAVVEAQAAGLPCIVADTVPQEATVIDELVTSLPLESANEKWQNAILEKLKAPRISQEDALKIVEQSDFNILKNVKDLSNLYQELCTPHRKKGRINEAS